MDKHDHYWSSRILETGTDDDIQNIEYKYVIDVLNYNKNGDEENADWEPNSNRKINLIPYFQNGRDNYVVEIWDFKFNDRPLGWPKIISK